MGDRQVPIPFAVELPADAIDEASAYALVAEILIDGAGAVPDAGADTRPDRPARRGTGIDIRVHRHT